MKDKFIITISDINGSKQYTLSQFIKVVVSWIILVVVILFIIGVLVVNYLSNHVKMLENDKKELSQQKEVLIKEIIKSQETLQSMDEQLKQAKELIGIRADENSTVIGKKNISEDKSEDEDKSENNETKNIVVKSDKDLTISEYMFLTRLIPNGKPLNYKRISTKFGFRIHPITKRKQLHSADDLTADIGTPIYAPADGVVVYAGKRKFYGNFLLIRHGMGFETAYGHLHRIGVKTGDYIKKGELIALCGNTGRSTGPHLHYEIRYLSKWLDPEPFIKEWSFKTYKEVIKKNKIVKWDSMIQKVREEIELIKNKKKLEKIKKGGE